jgi:hypothetical protein
MTTCQNYSDYEKWDIGEFLNIKTVLEDIDSLFFWNLELAEIEFGSNYFC